MSTESTDTAGQPRIDLLHVAEDVPVQAGYSASTLRVTLPAGSAGNPPHRHPGPVFGYLVRGAMKFEVEGQPPRIIREGEAFWEPGGDLIHFQDANALEDAETEFVVTVFAPPGEEILTPVSEAELEERKGRRVA